MRIFSNFLLIYIGSCAQEESGQSKAIRCQGEITADFTRFSCGYGFEGRNCYYPEENIRSDIGRITSLKTKIKTCRRKR